MELSRSVGLLGVLGLTTILPGARELLAQQYMVLASSEGLLDAEASKSSPIPRRDGQLQAVPSRVAREARCSENGRSGADPVYRVFVVVLAQRGINSFSGLNKRHVSDHPVI